MFSFKLNALSTICFCGLFFLGSWSVKAESENSDPCRSPDAQSVYFNPEFESTQRIPVYEKSYPVETRLDSILRTKAIRCTYVNVWGDSSTSVDYGASGIKQSSHRVQVYEDVITVRWSYQLCNGTTTSSEKKYMQFHFPIQLFSQSSLQVLDRINATQDRRERHRQLNEFVDAHFKINGKKVREVATIPVVDGFNLRNDTEYDHSPYEAQITTHWDRGEELELQFLEKYVTLKDPQSSLEQR